MAASLWAQAVAELNEEDQKIFQVGAAELPEMLRDILSRIKSQHDRSQLNHWKIRGIRGQEIIVGDVCAKIAACVQKFMSVVDVAVSFDPVHTALAWAGVRFVLQLCVNSAEIFQAIVEGLEKASSVIARGGIVESLYLRGHQSDSQKARERELKKLYKAVLNFLCVVRKYYHSKRPKYIRNLTNKQILEDAVRHMEEAEQKFQIQKELIDGERIKNIADGVEEMQGVHEKLETTLQELDGLVFRAMGQMSDIYSALQKTERSVLLKWLSPIHVQEHYRAELTSLLQDSAGCEKTKLITAVIKHLRQRGGSVVPHPAPIAHFYCSRDPAEPERSDAREILRSVLKQLSLSTNEECLRRPTVDEYQKKRQEAEREGESLGALNVEECIQLICELGRTTPATIIIDALDECESQQRALLISALDEILSRSGDVVKIFVSSRDEEDIAAHFRSGKSINVLAKANKEDLNRFVKNQVDCFIKRWSEIHGKTVEMLQQLKHDIVDTLIAGAQGMFLWVTLQLESISDTQRIKSEDNIQPVLASLPSTLSKSYEAIHNRIQSMGEKAKIVAIEALRWLLYSLRRLSTREFIAAVGGALSADLSVESVLDYCCNLVVLDKETNSFRLAHLTVREYLESLEIYSINESNYTIACRCLGAYIWGPYDENNLIGYATHYWPAHLEQIGSSAQRAMIQPLLSDFFTQEEHFEDWLEYLEKEPMAEGPGSGNALERKLEASFSIPASPLFVISCFGLIEILEQPDIRRVLDLDQKNKHNTSGLYLAARWGHTRVVLELLSQGVDVDSPGYQYGTALHAASFAGHEAIVKILLEMGASLSNVAMAQIIIDSGFKFGTQKQFDDALEVACFKGSMSIVQKLLNNKAGKFAPKHDPDLLQIALFARKKREVKKLMENCGDINEVRGQFGNALQAAIAGGNYSLVNTVVEAGARLDLRGCFGYPLRAAVIAKKIDIVKYLLERGADPNAKDDELGDALQAASSSGNLDIMLILLDKGADVDGHGGFFKNTLQAAAFGGYEQAVHLLLEHGAKLDNHGRSTGRYRDALQAAVYAGKDTIVEILLEKGAEFNPRLLPRIHYCRSNYSSKRMALPGELDIPTALGPLEIAARQGNTGLIRMFLDKGAKIDVRRWDSRKWNDGDYTALQIAAFWGHTPAVKCLLDYGADINAVGQALGTPLQAALESLNFDLADLLLARGAEIDKHWTPFGSCLQVFCERGNIEIVEYLLKRGASIEDHGGENGNALRIACDAGHVDAVRLLLNKGADVNAPGKNNGNALQAAATSGHLQVVELLLNNGAKVDDAESAIESALHMAAANGHEQVVPLLLARGANVDPTAALCNNQEHLDVCNYRRKEKRPVGTPLQLAAWYGHENVVSLLLENGADIHLLRELPRQQGGIQAEWTYTKRSGNALFAACRKGYTSIAKLLFLHDPWSYVKHKTFASALEASIAVQRDETAAMMIREGVNAGFLRAHFDCSFDFACQNGHVFFINELLNHFSLPNWSTSILQAAAAGSSAAVAILLNKGANVNCVNENGYSALALAVKVFNWTIWDSAWSDRIEAVRILIEAGANVDDLTDKIDFLTYAIAKIGRVDVFQTIERHGGHLFLDAEAYSKALLEASREGHANMVRYLSTKRTPTALNIEPAIMAVLSGNRYKAANYTEVVRILTSLNIALCFPEDGPLVFASKQGNADMVKLLLPCANHSMTTIQKSLEVAIYSGSWNPFSHHIECVQAILEFANDRIDWSQICIKLELCGKGEMLEYLLRHGSHPDSRYSNGAPLICVAAERGAGEIVKILLKYGANPNLEGGKHGTALHAAAVLGSVDIVKLLLDAGAHVNSENTNYGTPLVVIMTQKWIKNCGIVELELADSSRFPCHMCCARLLLDCGADIHAHGGSFGTALQAATKAENEDGVKMLLEWDATLNM